MNNKEELKKEILEVDKWYQEVFWPSANKGLSEFVKIQSNVVKEYRNMLQQLAIVSGAIATFSLMLISANIKVQYSLLLFGVILLLINTGISFFYLFYAQRKDSKNLSKYEKDKIIPSMNIRSLYFNFLNDVSLENLKKFNIGKEENLKTLAIGQFDEYKKAPTDKSDLILLFCFSLGIIFIILSIVLPYIFC